ncbi:hypothetical protein [Granulicoccus phenolivorans]|uniref:hypothetical protein n=1 Tax=Granulicoccus phenolivorans TaxID=266854 RepID=UPI0004223A11|nr:hypothetical protein [Granulicoccus phenolivorans]
MAQTSTIRTTGLTRAHLWVVSLLIAAAVGGFVVWSVGKNQAIVAAITCTLAAIAFSVFGGPQRRARVLEISDDGLRVLRFNRIRTDLDRAELAAAEVTPGRLELTPSDPAAFVAAHPELGDQVPVSIPIGTGEATATAVRTALAEHRIPAPPRATAAP